jgi:hypothetical protein
MVTRSQDIEFSLHTSYDLQLAAYAQAWNETHNDEKVTHTGILWVKANTRGEGKGGKIQGKGWELRVCISEIEKNFNMFKKYIRHLQTLENPDFKPMTELLPTSVKIS